MIEIKCTEEEKEILQSGFILCPDAICDVLTESECSNAKDCIECVKKNIKWTIRGNEDAE